jgi:hypothetical protein
VDEKVDEKTQFELVVTPVLPVNECLRLVAEAGLNTNDIVVKYVVGKKQQQTAELLIRYLCDSFGWLEMERTKSIETLKGKNKFGLIETYQSQICKVILERHGAIRRF